MPYYPLARDWTPDQDDVDQNGLIDALNVFPDVNGFRPVRNLSVKDSVSASLTMTEVVGGLSTISPTTGLPVLFASSRDRIWFLGGTVPATIPWTDVSRATAYAGAGTIHNFTFARYGSYVLAAHTQNAMQKASLTDTSGIFSDIGGSAPQARFITIVRDFAVAANLSSFPDSTVQWTALGNPLDWTASATTQSDSQVIGDEGPILDIIGGEYGLVFFANSIYRMTYIGSPVIFQFDKISSLGMGTILPASSSAMLQSNTGFIHGHKAVRLGESVFFLCNTGIAVVENGQIVRQIGQKRVSNWLINGLPKGIIGGNHTIGVDEANSRVVLASRPSSGTNSLNAAQLMIYDLNLDRFSRASMSAVFMFSGQMFPNAAAVVQPTQPLFFTSQNRLALWDGDTLPAVIETSDQRPFDTQRAMIRNVRVHMDGTAAPMILAGTKPTYQQGSASFSNTVVANSTGDCPQRASGQLVRFRVMMSASASWSMITGLDLDFVPMGGR